MRMSRRLGLISGLKLPSLYEFWSDATVVNIQGAHSSTAKVYSGLSVGDTSTPLWILNSKGDAWELDKLKDGSIMWWRDGYIDDNVTTLFVNIDENSTTSATKLEFGDGVNKFYGYVIAGFRFPSFTETIVDVMLKRINFSFAAYQYGSDTSNVYILDSALSNDPNDVYMQIGAISSQGYISATRGGTPDTAIMSSGNRAYWRHSNSRYYLSSNGTNNSSTRVGGIYRITL